MKITVFKQNLNNSHLINQSIGYLTMVILWWKSSLFLPRDRSVCFTGHHLWSVDWADKGSTNSVVNEVFTTKACLDDKTRYVCKQVVGQTRRGRWSESLIHKHTMSIKSSCLYYGILYTYLHLYK